MVKIFPDLFKWRSLIFYLSLTSLKLRYKGTAIGVFWSFLEPLLLLTVFYFVFSSIFGSSIEHYPLYIFIGLIMFHMFVRATSMGLSSISNNSNIVGNIKIPLFIIPVSFNVTALIMMGFDLCIFFVFMAVSGFIPPVTILLLPFDILMIFVLTVGISLPLSIFSMKYKDLHYLWNLLVSTLIFVTPIFYKLDSMPEWFQEILSYSPWVRLVTMTQNHTLYGEISFQDYYYVIPFIVTILVSGYVIFRRKEFIIVRNI